MYWLAWYRHKQSDSRETIRSIRPLLEAAALQGHPAAQLMLGRFMAKGRFGMRHIRAGWKHLRRVSGTALSAESGS
jgi:TPR repeat protein